MSEQTDTGISAAAEETPATAPIVPAKISERIDSLDFIRGLAVMGILWANIAGFGQPFNAVTFPDAFIGETGDSGGWLWISQFVLIDGKMRGLFTLLFGAGMYLFMERAWERGATRALQLWRLVILLIFGLVHFFFIWMGDILVMYSLIGFVAVACMRWTAKSQMIVGAIGYVFGALLMFAAMTFPYAIVDTPLGETPELAEQRTELVASIDQALADDKVYTDLKQSGDYWGLVEHRFGNDGLLPLANSGFFILETLPLMLMGMALYRFGFFSGAFNRSKMVLWGWVGLIGGAAGHLGLGLFAKSAGFSYFAVNSAYIGWSQLPRIAMIIGMAALLVVYSPAWSGWLAKRIRAAGRAAFSNYLGTSIIMLFVFHGWALGLFGELNRPQLYLVAAATCGLMLLWSKPWLDRFRYGPLEWLWRCMTYRKLFAFKR